MSDKKQAVEQSYGLACFFRLQYVQYGVISLCGFVTLIALLLIVFGYLATKATRQHMYREDVCTMGGRCTACCVSSPKFVSVSDPLVSAV